jgi:tetratricopeptide (TPR) repeat protein
MLDSDEYFHLALHASGVGDHHACLTYLDEVLQREPRHARAIYLRAVQHMEIGLTQRAITGIENALAIDPDMEVARFQLGLLLIFDRNRPIEAKHHLERLSGSQNRALCAFAEALIALAANELILARQKLAIGLSGSPPKSPLAMLMRRVFERMSNDSSAMSAPRCPVPPAISDLPG